MVTQGLTDDTKEWILKKRPKGAVASGFVFISGFWSRILGYRRLSVKSLTKGKDMCRLTAMRKR